MQLSERIINLLKKGPLTFKELKKELNLNSYDDNKKLDKELRSLWNDKKVFFKKSKNTYHLKNEEEFIGTFKETKNDFAFVENDDFSVFIPGRFVLNALHGDTVKVVLFPLKEDEDPSRRAGKVVRVMQRNGSAIIGRVTEVEGHRTFIPDDLVPKHEYFVEDLSKYDLDDILLTEFVDFVEKKVILKVKKVIGKTSEATLDPEIIGYKFDLRTSFPEEVLIEAEKIEPKDSDRRVDITDRLIYTIDGIESKDLDDAIDVSILENGNYKLGVHIADVSHFIKKDSLIDVEAETRGTSIYLIDTVYPMLPKRLSNDLCSLNPDTLKFTLTCDMEISKNGEVIRSNIYESKIISKHRLTYNQVDELYNGQVDLIENEELTKSLLLARELSDTIREIKVSRGMIDFSLSEAKVKLDEKGEVVSITNKTQTPSEKVIEDLMVVTNETVARTLTENKLPSIFRIHPEPKVENIAQLSNIAKTLGEFLPKAPEDITSKDLMNFIQSIKGKEYEDIMKRYMIQTMEKALYFFEDNGHYALGLKNYLHFTSPIRRYPDLVVHRNIKEYFLDKNAEENKKIDDIKVSYLDSISKSTSERERVAIQCERKILDIKKSRFMKQMVGQTLPGKIVSVVKFGFFVEFENLTQGLVHIDNLTGDEFYFDETKFSIIGKENKKQFKLGDKLNTRINNVDVIRGLIDLEVA